MSQSQPREGVAHIIVDAMNVIGTTPDGWWRDRDGAARRLVERLARWDRPCTGEGDPVALTVVLDGRPLSDLAEGAHTFGASHPIEVLYARRSGRNAADDRIAEYVSGLSDPAGAIVVTSDRGLALRVREAGAETMGARAFLGWLG